jgi:alpha-D-xyloside xylohydrolase
MSSAVLHQADFSRLSQLSLVGRKRGALQFEVDGVPLVVSRWPNDTLRLTIGVSTRADYALLQTKPDPRPLTCTRVDDGWHIDCGALQLQLHGTPLRLRLLRDGQPILSSITDQHFRGRSRLPAFGHQDGKRWCASLALASDTAVYGLGEKYGPLNKRGQLVRGRTEDALGVNTELSYKNIPFSWSPDGWGLLAHTPAVVRHGVGFGQWSHRSYVIDVEDDSLDLFLFSGSPANILDSYSILTGRPALAPLWSLGMWLSRAYYKTPEEAIETAAELRRRRIPCDVITLDGRAAWEVRTRFSFEWDKSRFKQPKQSLVALKAFDLKVCVWEYPCVSIHNPLFKTLADKGWLLKKSDGSAYVFDWVKDPTDDPFGSVLTPLPPSGLIDFTQPQAAAFWADSHNALFDDGVDVMKTDFGEQVEDDMHAANGDSGARLHNVYPLLYNGCVYNATKRYNAAHGRGPAMVWGRDGFTGSQRFPMQWGGDPQTDWEGMAASIRGALSYGMSGVPYYSSDVGGFYGAQQPDPELYLRWTANGIFCSHFRYHGIGVREPWGLGEDAERVARQWLQFRYRLIPYIYGAMEQAASSGLPLMRAMALAFPHDRAARAYEMQYMFGDALLVAPIIAAGGSTEVWFPAGDAWYDLGTGERIEGGQARRVHKTIDQLPVYGREGHMLCLGAEVQHTGEIDLEQPIEQVWLFGLPRHAPCVMHDSVTFKASGNGGWLDGIDAANCLPSNGVTVTQRGSRVRIEPA